MPPSHPGSTSAGRAEAVAHHPSPGHRSPYRCGCRRRRGEASRRRPSESPSRSCTRPAGRDGWWQTGATAPTPLWGRLPHRHQTHSQQTHSPVTSRPPRWRCADLLRQVFAVDAFAGPKCTGPMRVIPQEFLGAVEVGIGVRHALTHTPSSTNGHSSRVFLYFPRCLRRATSSDAGSAREGRPKSGSSTKPSRRAESRAHRCGPR